MAAEIVGVIPARFSSTRLPGKALVEIEGVPMVVRVWRQTARARMLSRVVVATDDERIARAVGAAGGEAMMTSPAHQSGTDRIAEVAAKVPAAIYVNVQGDLPFIDPADIDALAAPMRADDGIAMATLATPILDGGEWHNPNVVKVVCDGRGDALYFSRARFRGRARAPRRPRRRAAISECTPTAAISCCGLRSLSRACSRGWKSSNNYARWSAAFASGWWLPWRLRLR